MIDRYNDPQISKIWSEENRFTEFLKTELLLLESFEKFTTKVPVGTAQFIRENAQLNLQRIKEIESEVQHDVVAFCTSITEQIPMEKGRYFHYGVTSSDIIDTSISVMTKKSLEFQCESLVEVIKTLWQLSCQYKNQLVMGRTHGKFAEPLSLGQKFLGFYSEFYRRYLDLKDLIKNDCTIKISGATGNYTHLKIEQELWIASKLNMPVEPVSNQVLPRDRLAKILSQGALLASAVERICIEIRHLNRSEVGEISEGFSKNQKGSSIMPHKKNPISTENLTGIARVIRSHSNVGLENISLWHERDISHSSAERLILPDNFGLMNYCLKRLQKTLANLQVHEEVIDLRLEENKEFLSSIYLHHLIDETNLSREDIYRSVQNKTIDLELKEKISSQNLKKFFLKEVEGVFKRVQEIYPPL
jgi:adenylosuccinate lyase